MVKDLIVEGEVIARDEINAGVLLDLPVLETKALALAHQLITRELSTPVGLSSLLEVSQATHTREAEHRATIRISTSNPIEGQKVRGRGQHLRLNHFESIELELGMRERT